MSPVYRFIVYGHVQGVGFRKATRVRARTLGLRGWVRNLPDGSVEGVANGEVDALQSLWIWLRRGPALAKVQHVEWLEYDGPAPDNFPFMLLRDPIAPNPAKPVPDERV